MQDGLMRTAKDWLLYVSGRLVLSFLQALPWSAGRAGGRLLGDLGYAFDRRSRKKESLENLRRAFPSMSEREAWRTLRGVYRHLGESIVNGLNVLRFAGHRLPEDLFETVGFERLRQVSDRGGAILVTGHFGHWEVLGTALPLMGFPVWSMERKSRNRFVQRYVRRLREKTGQKMLAKRGVLRRIARLVKEGQNVAMLIDQDARRDGVFVDFFGRPASTTAAPARLATYTGCPVVFGYARAIRGSNRFRLVVRDVVFPRPGADREAEVHRITQELTRSLEATIRQAPEEWLWIHRRWKTFPGKYRRV